MHCISLDTSVSVGNNNPINWHDTTHFDSEDDYPTGCRSISHGQQQIQDYVYPHNQTQPTFEMTPGFKPFTVGKYIIFILQTLHLCLNLCLFSVFACLGFLSPANRGALMTCSLVSGFVIFVCCIVCKMVFFYDLT